MDKALTGQNEERAEKKNCFTALKRKTKHMKNPSTIDF